MGIEGLSDNEDEEDNEAQTQNAGAFLSSRQGETILGDARFRLPSGEAEWEFVAREGGNEKNLFQMQDPDDDVLRIPTESDDVIWSFDYSKSQTHTNSLGVCGRGSFPELCADIWRPNLKETPTDGSPYTTCTMYKYCPTPHHPRRCRGALGPWQDCGEWQKLLVCARSPGPRTGGSYTSVRLAMDLLPSPLGG
jgi:hypothetical protein